MRRAVVVNADDLGLSRDINEGIFAGLELGAISDVSILIHAPNAFEAVGRLRVIGLKSVGLHINLDERLGWSSPGRERLSRPELMALLDTPAFLKRCREDARMQIEQCIACGLEITHIDTHHHVHGFFPLFTEFLGLAKEYRIPAMRHSRNGYTLTTRQPIPFDPSRCRRMEELMRQEGVFFCSAMVEGAGKLEEIPSFPAELVVHPSRGADPWRKREMETLTSPGFQSCLEAVDVRIVSFKDLVGRGSEPGGTFS